MVDAPAGGYVQSWRSRRPVVVVPQQIRVDFFLAAIPMLLACALPGQLLAVLGVNYMNGAMVEKIHVATYLSLIFVGFQALVNRQDDVRSIARLRPGAFALPLGATGLAVYVGLFRDVQATGLPDTWVLPSAMFFLCALLNTRERGALGYALDAFFLMNSFIGIYEAMFHARIIPFTVASEVEGVYRYPIEYRSSGLIGHPLPASYVTGVYILLLVLDGRIKPMLIRLPLIAMHLLALFCFGSRAAAALVFVVLLGSMLYQLLVTMRTGRLSKDLMIYVASGLFGGLIGVPVVLASGFLDRFLQRLEVDHGSAEARTGALEMFANIEWSDLFFGPPKQVAIDLGKRFGVGDGIESFWLGYLFLYGVIGCVIFMPTLFVFLRDLARHGGRPTIAALIFFFGCATTSVSISSKSLTVAILVGLCLTSRNPPGAAILEERFARNRRSTGRRLVSPGSRASADR